MREYNYDDYTIKASDAELNLITKGMLEAQEAMEITQKKSAHGKYMKRLHKAVTGEGKTRILLTGEEVAMRGGPNEARMHYGQQLIKHFQQELALRIRAYAFMGDQEEGVKAVGGRKSFVQTIFYRFGHDTILANYALQYAITGISDGKLTWQSVCHSLGSKIEIECKQEAVRQASDVLAKLTGKGLVARKGAQSKQREFINKRMRQTGAQALEYAKKNKLTGSLSEEHKAWLKARKDLPLVEFDDWTNAVKSSVGEALMIMTVQMGLVERYTVSTKGSCFIRGTERVMELIESYKDAMMVHVTDRFPLVCPPRPWSPENIRDGIYYTSHSSPMALIKYRTPQQLTMMADPKHEAPLFWKALNGIQMTNWAINRDVYDLLKNVIERASEAKHRAIPIEGMAPLVYKEPVRSEEWHEAHRAEREIEVAKMEADVDYEPSPEFKAKDKLYLEFLASRREWHSRQSSFQSGRLQVLAKMANAELYLDAAYGFYFGYTVDFRGRVYCSSHGITPQGDDLSKGLLRFHSGKPLGKRGAYWLKVHAANLFGLDKKPFDERVKWSEENMETLLRIAREPLENENISLWTGGEQSWVDAAGNEVSCEAPFQAYAICRELLGWSQEGDDFMSHIAIPLDGSCSGLQNLAMALRCQKTANTVNVEQLHDILEDGTKAYRDEIADIYGRIAVRVDASLRSEDRELEEPEDDEEEMEGGKPKKKKAGEVAPKVYAQQWLKFLGTFGKGFVSRSETKRPVMTFVYGSGVSGYKNQIMDDTIKPAYKRYRAGLEAGTMTEADWPFHKDGYMAAAYMAQLIYKAVQAEVELPALYMTWAQKAVAALVKQKKKKVELEHTKADLEFRDKLLKKDKDAIDHKGVLRKKYVHLSPKREDVVITWKTITGFIVAQHYNEKDKTEVKVTVDNTIVKTQYRFESDVSDSRSHRNGIAPNTVHSFDAAHLQMVVNYALDKGMTDFALIHDSFGTHAGNTDEFAQCIRQAFYDMYTKHDVIGDLYEHWLSDFLDAGGDAEDFPSLDEHGVVYGTLDPMVVLSSTYAFA